MEAEDFIKGEWYRGLTGTSRDWYIRFHDIINIKMYASEWINDDKIYVKSTLGNEGYFGNNDDYKWKLVDIDEIREFLPDNHPDKLIKPIVNENMDYLVDLLQKLNIK